MLPKKHELDAKCAICQRDHSNDRVLGPLIRTLNISVHLNCVLYSPSVPDLVDSGIAGVSMNFIKTEAARAEPLVDIQLLVLFFRSSLYSSYVCISPLYRSAIIAKKRARAQDAASTSAMMNK